MERINFCQMTYGERVWQTLICLKRVAPAVQRMVVLVDETVTEEQRASLVAAGAEVLFFPWTDHFSDYRNHYLDAVPHGEWVLTTDPDELLSGESVEAVPRLANSSDGGRAYNLVLFRATDAFVPMVAEPVPAQPSDFRKEFLFLNGPGVRYSNRVHHTLGGHRVVLPTDLTYTHFRTAEEMQERGCRNFFVGGGGQDEADDEWRQWRSRLADDGIRTWPEFRRAARSGTLPAWVRGWAAENRQRRLGSDWRTAELRAFHLWLAILERRGRSA